MTMMSIQMTSMVCLTVAYCTVYDAISRYAIIPKQSLCSNRFIVALIIHVFEGAYGYTLAKYVVYLDVDDNPIMQ